MAQVFVDHSKPANHVDPFIFYATLRKNGWNGLTLHGKQKGLDATLTFNGFDGFESDFTFRLYDENGKVKSEKTVVVKSDFIHHTVTCMTMATSEAGIWYRPNERGSGYLDQYEEHAATLASAHPVTQRNGITPLTLQLFINNRYDGCSYVEGIGFNDNLTQSWRMEWKEDDPKTLVSKKGSWTRESYPSSVYYWFAMPGPKYPIE